MKKSTKISIYILIGISIFIGLTYLSSGLILKGILQKKIENQHIADIYKIEFKNAYFDIFNMGFTVTGLELIPDSTEDIMLNYKYHKQIAHINIKRAAITSFDILLFLQEQQIDINKIRIIKPQVKLYKNKDFINKKAITQKDSSKHNSETTIDLISLDEILFKDFSLEYYITSTERPDLYIKSINISLINPVIDHKKFPEINKVLTIDEIKMNMQGISFFDKNGLYEIELKNLILDDENSSVLLNNLSISPRLSKKEFAKRSPFQIDRFDGKVKQINIKQIDIAQYLDDGVLIIDHIIVDDANFEIYRDKNFPFNTNNLPKLPQQAIRHIKQALAINTIDLTNVDLVYMETAEGVTKPGKIEFKNTEAHISHFGNTKDWQSSQEMKIELKTQVYGKGNLIAQFNFPLASNTFYFSGQLAKTQMDIFNEMTINAAGIKVKEGIIDKMSFDVVATSTKATGNLDLYYHDLKIALLKDENENGQVKEKKMLNFLANNLLVPVQNPNKNGQFYEAKIDFDRVKNKGVLNYLWKSIFSGIKDTFLKDHKDEQSYSKKNAKSNSGLSKRELRKKARQEKRDKKNNSK
ncbi:MULTISPECIES: hypothetical protein [unclassified Lentimicrobium]|uniref:hypothetical protein n=1 Tax=unclassified Lentimicrobium TaxID=2677434 RepID=UPI001553F89B|nr:MULTISPECIES: hypothetical protein [unclassified Lentimicrobium]NPD46361.1 hypothetical protein [Lentimicrobium sp. S6]NPD85000.1 hypothetical protein [Lentimicrobium sp. L6]